ncbi:AAA family ATPase [Sporosarcina gallistercoris]|uniref:ParA family protein n=1 Tax=Sporosarcina gallistercoris TaxID=2762245 RepID=UPI003D2B64B6
MVKIISLFNNKGGVSKTTTTFHLGWMLAEKGQRVLMIDADSQCNLTGVCLNLAGIEDIESFYEGSENNNIKSVLEPVFEGLPKELEAANCFEIPGRDNLFLLPGHIAFSEYDVPIGISQELTGSLKLTQNIPGALHGMILLTAEKYNIDIVLIDMSPSVTATNANILMQSDYFMVPCSPDYFCNMAINSLIRVLPEWDNIYSRIKRETIFKNAYYKLPNSKPRFIGTILQRYRPKNGIPSKSFQTWIDRINNNVEANLIPTLKDRNMIVEEYKFEEIQENILNPDRFNLVYISDFNSLIAQSQKYNVPVFSLTKDQLEQFGKVLSTHEKNRDVFKSVFSDLADKILHITR